MLSSICWHVPARNAPKTSGRIYHPDTQRDKKTKKLQTQCLEPKHRDKTSHISTTYATDNYTSKSQHTYIKDRRVMY